MKFLLIPSDPRVLASVWLPLNEAMLCLDDECVFSVRDRACPQCGSKNFTALARFLQERPHPPTPAELADVFRGESS